MRLCLELSLRLELLSFLSSIWSVWFVLGRWGQIFILDNAGLSGPGEIGFTFHGINLFGLFG
jgi:hypothetical protein